MRGHTRTGLRVGAYVASGALALSGAVLAVTPAQAAVDPMGLEQGATWLAGQIDDGLVPGQFGGPDVGLSIDTALSLRTAGGHDADVTEIADAIEDNGTSYLEYEYTYNDHDYAGQAANATAKAMALFQTLSPARTTIGTINVQTRLESLTASTGPIAGRLVDVSTEDGDPDGQDYANTLGQSFAAYALTKAGSSKAADAVAFLLDQQCANGGFRLSFTADKTATDQSCTDNAQAQTDSTSIALQELNQIPATPDITSAKTAARAYLVGTQKTDGSWGGGTGTEASNANSTGLAATALGDVTEARSAARWLRDRQATYYDLCNGLATQRGAMAYSSDSLQAGRENGITSATADQWRRATAQALPALQYLQEDTTPSTPAMTGPTGYLKAGAKPSVTITGVNAGDLLCLRGSGVTSGFTATGATTTKSFTLPGGTATRTYTLRDADGHVATTSLKVLGAKTLTVTRTPGTVKRGALVTVAARGLADGEAAKIYYGSTLVKSGAASSAGNLVARFSAGSSVGTKSIRAYGRFTDIRKGATTVKVVR